MTNKYLPATAPAITVEVDNNSRIDGRRVLAWCVGIESLLPVTVTGGAPMSSRAAVVELPADQDEILGAARREVRADIERQLNFWLVGRVGFDYVGEHEHLRDVSGTLQPNASPIDKALRLQAVLTGEVEWTVPNNDDEVRVSEISCLVELFHQVDGLPYTDRLNYLVSGAFQHGGDGSVDYGRQAGNE